MYGPDVRYRYKDGTPEHNTKISWFLHRRSPEFVVRTFNDFEYLYINDIKMESSSQLQGTLLLLS